MADASDKIRDALTKMQALQDAVKELKRPDNMRKFGEQIKNMIRIRTRVGFAVDRTGESKHKLKDLSPGYIEQRRKQQANATEAAGHGRGDFKSIHGPKKRSIIHGAGGLSDETTPSKSNLTRTGQMLDSVDVKGVGDGTVSVGPTGSRSDSSHTNAEIAEFQAEKGRKFNNLSDIELKRLNDSIKTQLRSLIRERLTK